MIGLVHNVIQKNQGSKVYYFGTISSDKVKSVTFVPVLEPSKATFLIEDIKDGYQRPGSQARMKAFARFLREYPNSVVPPVLLSARGNWRFVPESDGSPHGSLELSGPAAIIDGQHRVGGYVGLFENKDSQVRDIPFILLADLSLDEEKNEFVVVNNSQKGVPKSLTMFLNEDDDAMVAWALNEAADSPFKGRISRTKMESTQLFQLHSVARQMGRLFNDPRLEGLDVETRVDYATRFFNIVADALPSEWQDIERLDEQDSRGRNDFKYKLLELTGLIAWCLTGSAILSRSYTEDVGVNWDNVKRLVDAVKDVDWDKEGQYLGRTGEVGGKAIHVDMMRKLPGEGVE